MAADDINGVVYAIKSDGTVTPNVFNWTAPDWDGAEGVFVIPSNPCTNCSGGAFFQAVYTSNLIYNIRRPTSVGWVATFSLTARTSTALLS